MANNFKVKSLVLAMGMTAMSMPVLAADEANNEDEAQTMVIVGSRSAPRSVGDSAVPVDVISAEEMLSNGTADMTQLLATVAPSFNVGTQPISDAATMTRPANLRGLSPDSTLILVNGKRRHRGAVIAFLGGGISDGAQGPDTSVIPAIALKQVEVLRDGASAQYGSDAIAGVINFVLKDNNAGGVLEVKKGKYAQGDGEQTTYAANIGMPLTERGFVNFSFELNNQNPTSRSVQRADAQGLIDAGNTNVRTPNAQIWGSPEINDDLKTFWNVGLELDNKSEAYMFGNFAQRTVDGGFFFRNPNTRGGVFRGPSLDGTGGLPLELDANGNPVSTILVGDLTPGATDNSACPIVRVVNNVPDAAALAALGAANCFSFNDMFPGGFTPNFGGQVTDISTVIGTRGETESGTSYDISASLGQNQADFVIRNTVNASLGPNTPTSFRPGSYTQLEKAVNADFSSDIDDTTIISYGIEFREESFEITNGDKESFEIGPLASQGFSIGSNGFQGFKPEDAGVFSRRSKAAYLDLESDVTDELALELALRFEDFSDFGNTFDWKVSGRYEVNDNLSVRGSKSTGFRAPTVGQANVRNVSTTFGPGGFLEEIATLPPTNPVSLSKGGKTLTPEQSESWTLGGVYEQGDFFLTVDYYNIDVTDRISQTSNITLSNADRAALIAQGVNDAVGLAAVRFFTNDFDTTTTGYDIVANYSHDALGGEMKYALAYNHTATDVTSDITLPGVNINAAKVRQLEEGLPQERYTFTANLVQDSWRLMARLNYFGSYYEAHLDDPGLPIDVGEEYTIDTEFSVEASDALTLSLGANNLLNEYPDRNPWDWIVGAKYPTTSPMGFNGRFLYARVNYKF
ncbi:MAG: TonB-dependent receptor [Enterobacterales bacterium]|nr:TonB-dependent receptor [Enterobacterales bacterium]